ncbi:MAG: hypothetical protein ACT4P4_27320 [Betaproteobacteria bacterium]
MRTFLALLAFSPLVAVAQVTVQEYPVPPGHRVHDVWADAAPGGPVWISDARQRPPGHPRPEVGQGVRSAGLGLFAARRDRRR